MEQKLVTQAVECKRTLLAVDSKTLQAFQTKQSQVAVALHGLAKSKADEALIPKR